MTCDVATHGIQIWEETGVYLYLVLIRQLNNALMAQLALVLHVVCMLVGSILVKCIFYFSLYII